jgi:hypothetical protein
MTTIADVQAALALAQNDLAALTVAVNNASKDAALVLADLNTIANDLAALTPSTGTMPPPAGYTAAQRIFEDEFAGTALDLSKWNTFYGPGVRWDNRGALPAPYSGGNTPLTTDVALYNPSQVVVNNGLSLNAIPGSPIAPYTWLSGVITTKAPLPSSGWYVQVKAKRPDTSAGMWPADWFLPANDAQELDGYEGGWPGSSPNQQGHSDVFAAAGQDQSVWVTGVDLSAGFHVYGYHFAPGSGFDVYVDGVHRFGHTGALSPQGYFLFLQLQVAGPQTSGWHTTGGNKPGTMQVAEVQIYA